MVNNRVIKSVRRLDLLCFSVVITVLIRLIKLGCNILIILPVKYQHMISEIITRRRQRLKRKRQKRARKRLCKRYMALSEHRSKRQWLVTITETDIDFPNFD